MDQNKPLSFPVFQKWLILIFETNNYDFYFTEISLESTVFDILTNSSPLFLYQTLCFDQSEFQIFYFSFILKR